MLWPNSELTGVRAQCNSDCKSNAKFYEYDCPVSFEAVLAYRHYLVALNQGGTSTNALLSNGLVAWIGALTGLASLFLHWYRGRPKLAIETVDSQHSPVHSSNFSGTTLYTTLRIRNRRDTATTAFKAELTIEYQGSYLSDTFPLSTGSEVFPHVARGVLIPGHDILDIPMFFNLPNVELPDKKQFIMYVWHTHGRSRVFGITSRKVTT